MQLNHVTVLQCFGVKFDEDVDSLSRSQSDYRQVRNWSSHQGAILANQGEGQLLFCWTLESQIEVFSGEVCVQNSHSVPSVGLEGFELVRNFGGFIIMMEKSVDLILTFRQNFFSLIVSE